MSLTSRGRTAARRTIRAQRRIALVQALFWPALIGAAVLAGTVVALRIRRSRRTGESVPAFEPNPVVAGHEPPAVSG